MKCFIMGHETVIRLKMTQLVQLMLLARSIVFLTITMQGLVLSNKPSSQNQSTHGKFFAVLFDHTIGKICNLLKVLIFGFIAVGALN